MDIGAAIGAVSAAIGLAKELRSIDAQLNQAELKLKIADLTSALAEAKLGLVDVAESLSGKDAEIGRLTQLLAYRADALLDFNGFRYPMKDGLTLGAPICPVCEDAGHHIMVRQDRSVQGSPYVCPKCKAKVGFHGVFKAGLNHTGTRAGAEVPPEQ